MRIERYVLILGIILMMTGVASATNFNLNTDCTTSGSYDQGNCYSANDGNLGTYYADTTYGGGTTTAIYTIASYSTSQVKIYSHSYITTNADIHVNGVYKGSIDLACDEPPCWSIYNYSTVSNTVELKVVTNTFAEDYYAVYEIELNNDYAPPAVPPIITSWSNTKTNNDSLDIAVYTTDSINFNATANQTITTWSWFKNDVNQSNNFNNFTTNFTAGNHTINVNATNANGTSNTVIWNITVATPTITVSCPVGYCFLAMNYTNKTLQQLDDLQTNDTVQGWYNSAAQKYELHRTGYNFNQNVNVTQKWGFLYYFTKATDVTLSYTSVPSITLNTGWNLVGNMNTSARTLGDLKTSIGVNATSAKYYNRTTGSWAIDNATSVPAMESFFVYTNGSVAWSG